MIAVGPLRADLERYLDMAVRDRESSRRPSRRTLEFERYAGQAQAFATAIAIVDMRATSGPWTGYGYVLRRAEDRFHRAQAGAAK
jgi:hypothetical protein